MSLVWEEKRKKAAAVVVTSLSNTTYLDPEQPNRKKMNILRIRKRRIATSDGFTSDWYTYVERICHIM